MATRAFHKVLIANRGAIACRIIRTLRPMGIGSVAVYSEPDRHSLHVSQADEAICVGPAPALQSYLRVENILDAARKTGAEAIHPGYGFLSENASFAEACESAGIAFIGPTPDQMRAFGLKHTARKLASEAGVPLLPGTGLLASLEEADAAAKRIGYPVMLKSTAGGGGIGMRVCRTRDELKAAFEAVARISSASFGDSGLYLEKFIEAARHIEVQVFGDGRGEVLALGERDCSVQRRNQKVMEETPAPGLDAITRQKLSKAATHLCRSVQYRSAGTVEFVFDVQTSEFYFLEVNTRLQVEHGVTEEVTGVDLVEWMVKLAAGEVPSAVTPPSSGWSIQARIYAEDPGKNNQPSAGVLTNCQFPKDARIETWIENGTEVTPFYDPMLAKIIVKGESREAALSKLQAALAETRIDGIETNLRQLRQIVVDSGFCTGGVTTSYLAGLEYRPRSLEVIAPGTQTSVQDFPGRLGYWSVGVPPSGPMDSLAFRLANRIAGNGAGAAALEITLSGPTLRFHCETVFAITGAEMDATLDGARVERGEPMTAPAGSLLRFGAAHGAGNRAYLAVRGGFDVPEYLGSRSTFILGKFGGGFGRVLRAGDVLHFGEETEGVATAAPAALLPQYSNAWDLGVVYGPHAAPDFFTNEDIQEFFSTSWKVHFNSDRTGVRLIGPKPKWARRDGGEAGLHPSNIHDNAYAIGAVDFTGDMPVLLGPDGPSLGGFVCPAVIANAELWKLGQLKPGDSVRFRAISHDAAVAMDAALDACVMSFSGPLPAIPAVDSRESPVLKAAGATTYRPAGDRYLLVECGENKLHFDLRFRVHALQKHLEGLALPGIIDVTPGIRSLQIHYDSRLLRRETLLEAMSAASSQPGHLDDMAVPSRIVHLPLSWDDPATRLAIDRYMQAVRPDAPWCPSNIEFIRRINGLDSIDEVHRIVFDAAYVVLGLGDVYLGAPVATPFDPRHRLVTTKYNPARTWTPENAVGIGGAYLCVYGMEGPGGYQFVGRTVQMWNTHRHTKDFAPGSPWLLRFFDQIRFYPVGAQELLEMRDGFLHGRFPLRVEETEFRLRDYHAYVASIKDNTESFRQRQQQAFLAERERWGDAAQKQLDEPQPVPQMDAEAALPEGWESVRSPIAASVWKVEVEAGQHVRAGQPLVVLEAMKMEVLVSAPFDGRIGQLRCAPSAVVSAGQQLMTLQAQTATV